MKENILQLISDKKYSEVKVALNEMLVQDIAELIEELENPAEVVIIFRLLHKDEAADVFSYMESDVQEQIIQTLTDSEIKRIIEDLSVDDAVDIIEEMPANIVERILKNATPSTRNDINKLLSYGEETAGSIMTTEFLEIKNNFTVSEAIEKIRQVGKDMETINVLFVTNSKKVLIGTVDIKDLIISNASTKIDDIMEDNVLFGYTHTDQEEISNIFQKYDLLTLPIVDNEQRLVGIVTVDDVMQVIEEEATDDISKIGGMSPIEDKYLNTPVIKHFGNRIIWVLVMMVFGIFTGLLISKYEDALAAVPMLVSFMPVLMNTAGNCGSQSSTIIIRGLALNELTFKDYFKIFFKEMAVSLLLGLSAVIFMLIRVTIQYDITKALIICVSLFIVILIANFIGFSMPMLAKKLKLDPAMMAAPIITTILDCAVVLIYFSIASSVLGL